MSQCTKLEESAYSRGIHTTTLATFSKSELKTISGIPTGHWGLNYNMHKIG
jgi:hypothetical protein